MEYYIAKWHISLYLRLACVRRSLPVGFGVVLLLCRLINLTLRHARGVTITLVLNRESIAELRVVTSEKGFM